MKTKEEVIKEAWGKYFKRYKPDKNGWSKDRPQFMRDTLWFDAFKLETKEEKDVWYYRPKSLKGIENNNSWIRILSEADLPSEDCNYWGGKMYDNGKFHQLSSVFTKNEIFSRFKNKSITHYQPITKPQPPIF